MAKRDIGADEFIAASGEAKETEKGMEEMSELYRVKGKKLYLSEEE